MIAEPAERALLGRRICDLPISLGTGWLATQVEGLYDDLAQAGLKHFRPRVYFGDEWFSPEGLNAISLPFYLTDPRLMRLERLHMSTVEGGTPLTCRKLLRHEAGHSFDHAYRVSARPEWRALFGDPRRDYNPDAFIPDRRSRDFVRHLPGFYAQAHPDEDFAETFAVTVTPRANWRRAYQNHPKALAKLRFVERLLIEHASLKPKRRDDGSTCYAASRMRSTLRRFYERRVLAKCRVKDLTQSPIRAFSR